MHYVFDVDGTICFDGLMIEKRLMNELIELEKRGHNVIFASARPIRDLLPVVGKFSKNILIGGNGSIISKNGEIRVVSSLTKDQVNNIADLINYYCLDYIIDDLFDYSAKISKEHFMFKRIDPNKLAKNVSIEEIKTPIKISLIGINPLQLETIKKEIEAISDNLTLAIHREDNIIDITVKNVNKYTTLMKVIACQYCAFGNDSNDSLLLNKAKKGYFVGDDNFAKTIGIFGSYNIKKDPREIAKVISNLK